MSWPIREQRTAAFIGKSLELSHALNVALNMYDFVAFAAKLGVLFAQSAFNPEVDFTVIRAHAPCRSAAPPGKPRCATNSKSCLRCCCKRVRILRLGLREKRTAAGEPNNAMATRLTASSIGNIRRLLRTENL